MTQKTRAKDPQHRKPTMEALRALMVLAETNSVSETARQLGLSQPVVTKKLEVFKDADVCGAVLLRSDKRVSLTESGQAVVPAIRELVDRYDRIFAFLRGEDTAPQMLRIGTGSFAAEHYLPRALAALRKLVEECQVETRVCRGRDRILGAAQGRFDLSIVTHDENQVREIMREARLDESQLTMTRLAEHPLAVLAARDTAVGRELHKASAQRAVPLEKLTQWELIGPDNHSGIRRQLESRYPRGQLYFVAEGGGWAAAKAYASEGLGVAIVPLAVVTAADRKDLVARPLSKQLMITDSLIYRADNSNRFLPQMKDAIVAAARRVSKEA